MLFIYQIVVSLLLIISPAIIIIRILKNKEDHKDLSKNCFLLKKEKKEI